MHRIYYYFQNIIILFFCEWRGSRMQMDYTLLKSATQFFQPEQRKKEWYEEIEEEVCAQCPKMTYQQRIGGCVMLMAVG